MYSLTLTNMAEQDIKRLGDHEKFYQVQDAITDLSENPRPPQSNVLVDYGPSANTYLMKVDGCELLYNVNSPRQMITVLGIKP